MTATDQVAPDDAHQHALALAAVGLRVLPIKPGGKSPPTSTISAITPGRLAENGSSPASACDASRALRDLVGGPPDG